MLVRRVILYNFKLNSIQNIFNFNFCCELDWFLLKSLYYQLDVWKQLKQFSFIFPYISLYLTKVLLYVLYLHWGQLCRRDTSVWLRQVVDSSLTRGNEIFNISSISSLWYRDKSQRWVLPLNSQCIQSNIRQKVGKSVFLHQLPSN